ncbi:MAG: DegT/DnrJ/EryC1/StrS aminotransferase family protein [Actinobacteria bacterium]|nr:DegT/DnrJ/EryC1/StrS aminotransferase family protein [Actinomycetota bacterium]
MRTSYLPFSPPSIGEEEIDEVIDTLRSEWITTGPKVKRFEGDFAKYIGTPSALAVSSATEAMQVGLAAMGIGPGSEVITTPMTFCSTVHVIEQAGARPVLADVEPGTLNIDPAAIEKSVSKNTRAIMPVHLYGNPCDMKAIMEIARASDLLILEDAAHALPAAIHSQMIGTIGDLTAFSFYATKNITTAEGGMLTGDPELVEQARIWSLHGMSRDAYKRNSAEGSWRYEVVLPGFKCNMTDIQAAIGLHQLARLDGFQEQRRQIVKIYTDAFTSMPELQLPQVTPEAEPAWHIYAIRLNLEMLSLDRDRFIIGMKERNIGTSVHFIPVHTQPYYREKYGYSDGDFPVAFENFQRLVSLPLNPRMTRDDAYDVVEAVVDIINKHRR